MYRYCRNEQLFTVDVTKGSGKEQKTFTKILPYPTGYSVLPEPGGILDQPYRLIEFFEIFLRAERRVAFRIINK